MVGSGSDRDDLDAACVCISKRSQLSAADPGSGASGWERVIQQQYNFLKDQS